MTVGAAVAGAPVLDPSLPPDEQLLARARPNPRVEADRVTATGDPARVQDAGRQFQRAAAELDRAHEQTWRAQRALADGLVNNGAPVYDVGAHRRLLPADLAEVGTRLFDLGRRVGVVGQELGSAIGEVDAALRELPAELNRRRAAFAAEVEGARGPGGLVPPDRVAELLARRAAVAAELQGLVDGCGRRIVARIGRYEAVVADCRRLVDELDPGRVDTSGTRLAPILGGRLEGLAVPAPPGPAAEVNPVPPPLPREPGFTPGLAGGGPLITLPAPELGAGRQDGPGSGQRDPAPPVRIDASTANPVAGGRTHRGDFPRTAGPNDILVRYGNDGKVNNYQVYDEDGLPVKRVDVRGRPHGGIDTPHVQEFVRQVDPASGRIFVDKGSVRAANPDEVAGLL